MGLFRNLSLLFNDSLLDRMTALERRQELLEDYTDQKLDSMKVYHARVGKRERDEKRRGSSEGQENGVVDESTAMGRESPRVALIRARRARRGLHVAS